MGSTIIELPSLYPHQEKMRDDARAALAKYRRVILCAPPGTGKTRMAKWIMGSFANRTPGEKSSGKAMFVVHRRGLVDNASNSFSELPVLPHGLIMSGRDTGFDNAVHVASIDTILAWYVKGEVYDGHTFDFIVFDECHAHVPSFRAFIEAHDKAREKAGMSPAYVLGLSATPQHKELAKLFKYIVKGPSPQWLIDNKFLSPFRYFQCTSGDLGKLVRKGDDYTEASVAEAMVNLGGDLVKDWKKHAYGRATIGFFPRRSQAQEAVEMLIANGIKAAYVDGETPDDERRQMFKDMNDGNLEYIANIGVIERGTDIPRVGCVQMCTAVGNVVRWKQMIGRGSRIHPDVPDCIVLDHADGIRKHGFFEDDVEWSLEWGERPAKTHEARDSIECPSCGAVYRGGQCRQCGYEPTPKERKAQGLEFVGGELVEVTRKDVEKKKKKTNEELMVEALFRAGRSGRTFGQAYYFAKAEAEKQGTRFRVPAYFEIGGRRYRAVAYGSGDVKRKVSSIYGVTVGNHTESANPYRER